MYFLGLSEGSFVTIGLFAWSVLMTVLMAFWKLKEKSRKQDFIYSAKKEWEKDIEGANRKLSDYRDNARVIMDKFSLECQKLNGIVTKLDKENAISNNQIKAIFNKFSELNSELTASLDKIEINLKDEVKEMKAEFKEQNKEIREHIAKLYEKTQEKK
jgi:biopolymer transport protein ExbB/TolQ